jgi:large subunit ribosomal protein L24
MKKEWSSKWAGSSQPRKQRKYRANAPLHVKHKFLSANLSNDLRKQYERRSLPVRKGDEVQIERGQFRGMKGTVDHVELGKSRVYVEGVTVKKVDGSEVIRPVHASNIMITKLELGDKKRIKVIERKEEKPKEIKKPSVKQNKEKDKK